MLIDSVSTEPDVAHCILLSTVDELKSKLIKLPLVERTVYIMQRIAANAQWRAVGGNCSASRWLNNSINCTVQAIPSLELFIDMRSQARSDQLADIRNARYDRLGSQLC